MKEMAGGLLGGGAKGMLAPPPKLLGGPGPPGPSLPTPMKKLALHAQFALFAQNVTSS